MQDSRGLQVLILGAGTVGKAVARRLSSKHNVTLIDKNQSLITQIKNENADIRTVVGPASQISCLFEAGVTSADLCLALTGDDEVNIVAASIAKGMGVKRVAARVYAGIFSDINTFDYRGYFHIDRFLSIEHLTAMGLARTIAANENITVEYFGNGAVEMQYVHVEEKSQAINIPLRDLKLPDTVRIGTITRGEEPARIAGADDAIQLGDYITIVGPQDNVENVKRLFHTKSMPKRNIAIAGGGEVGHQLAKILLNWNQTVTVFERDETRAKSLCNMLMKATIVHGDASQRSFLDSEYLNSNDYFVACMGDDENNIMASVEAKQLGVAHPITVVKRADYKDVLKEFKNIEAVIPEEVLLTQIDGLLQSGPVVYRRPHLFNGNVNILEIEVEKNALITKNPLRDAGWSNRALFASVVRHESVLNPNADFTLQEKDVAIVIVDPNAEQELIAQFKARPEDEVNAASK